MASLCAQRLKRSTFTYRHFIAYSEAAFYDQGEKNRPHAQRTPKTKLMAITDSVEIIPLTCWLRVDSATSWPPPAGLLPVAPRFWLPSRQAEYASHVLPRPPPLKMPVRNTPVEQERSVFVHSTRNFPSEQQRAPSVVMYHRVPPVVNYNNHNQQWVMTITTMWK